MYNPKILLFGRSLESQNHSQMLLFHFSDLITKRRNSHSIPNPQKVKVSIKFWKLQTIFKTFKPKEKVLDGFKLPAPQECLFCGMEINHVTCPSYMQHTVMSTTPMYSLDCWCMGDDANDIVSFQFDPNRSVNYLKFTIAKVASWHSDIKPSAARLWRVELPSDEFRPYVSEGKWKALNTFSSNYLGDPLQPLRCVMGPPKMGCLHLVVQRPDTDSEFIIFNHFFHLLNKNRDTCGFKAKW